jgi:hypothetical protein
MPEFMPGFGESSPWSGTSDFESEIKLINLKTVKYPQNLPNHVPDKGLLDCVVMFFHQCLIVVGAPPSPLAMSIRPPSEMVT